jgi:hypothetical protein
VIIVSITIDTQTDAEALRDLTRRLIAFGDALGVAASDITVDATEDAITYRMEIDA